MDSSRYSNFGYSNKKEPQDYNSVFNNTDRYGRSNRSKSARYRNEINGDINPLNGKNKEYGKLEQRNMNQQQRIESLQMQFRAQAVQKQKNISSQDYSMQFPRMMQTMNQGGRSRSRKSKSRPRTPHNNFYSNENNQYYGSSAHLCRFNLKCNKPDCQLNHDTQNLKSPEHHFNKIKSLQYNNNTDLSKQQSAPKSILKLPTQNHLLNKQNNSITDCYLNQRAQDKIEPKIVKEIIPFHKSDFYFYNRQREYFHKVAIKKQCNVKIKPEHIEIKGTQQQIQNFIQVLNQFIDNFSCEIITNPKLVIVLKGLKKQPQFDKKYQVHTRRFGGKNFQSPPISQAQQNLTLATKPTIISEVKWGFKIFNDNKDAQFWDARVDKTSDFKDYEPIQNQEIEKYYQECCQGKQQFESANFVIKIDLYHYLIWGTSSDSTTWRQKNISFKNGQTRQLQRKVDYKVVPSAIQIQPMKNMISLPQQQDIMDQMLGKTYQPVQISYNKKEEEKNGCLSIAEIKMKQITINPDETGFALVGLPQDVADLKKELYIKSLDPMNFMSQINGGVYPVNTQIISNIEQKMKNSYSNKDFVSIAITNKFEDVQIRGFQHKEIAAKVIVILEKIKSHRIPSYWDNTIELLEGSNNLLLVKLKIDMPERIKVEDQFKITMPNAKIDMVQRIQNRKLWRVFQNEIEDVRTKNSQDPKISFMFHGTSQTLPDTIYKSEEGFNINYSNEGMWGKAIYFAQNSSYSNMYATQYENGFRQMFFAQVIIGKEIEMEYQKANRTLKEPPIQPGTDKKYDSVKGNTKGSDVTMVYSNKKAYPQYLITYREK